MYEELDREFTFDLDACASPENAKCERYFTSAEDGLEQRWTGRVFVNPPYGRSLATWVRKAYEAAATGDAELVVCLLPARTDTAWWHDYASHGEVRFLRGRLRFGDARAPAPFPSAVVVFRNAGGATNQPAGSPSAACEGASRAGVDLSVGSIKDPRAHRKCPGDASTSRGRQQGAKP